MVWQTAAITQLVECLAVNQNVSGSSPDGGVTFLFVFLRFISFLAVVGLCCCRAFSGCGKRGLLSIAVCSFLTEVAAFVVEHGLWTRMRW